MSKLLPLEMLISGTAHVKNFLFNSDLWVEKRKWKHKTVFSVAKVSEIFKFQIGLLFLPLII